MTVYLVRNIINGKKYIGQTTYTAKHRFLQHLADAKRGCQFPLHKEIREFGVQAFEYVTLNDDVNASDADEIESKFISEHACLVPLGYNVFSGGRMGFAMPVETRKKISKSLTGIIRNDKTKSKMSLAKKGQIPWSFGKTMSKEFCDKISASNKGRMVSAETRIKISQSLKGRKLSEETKLRISMAGKIRGMPDTVRQAAREANLGKKRSDKTIQKMKDAWVRRKTKNSLSEFPSLQ